MANFSLKLNSDFDQAVADFKQLEKVSDSARAKIEKFTSKFKTERIDKFIAKNKMNAAAIKATRGPMAALSAETKGLEREIQRLIRSGLDPESTAVKRLQKDYVKLSAQLSTVTSKTKTQNSAFKNNIKTMIMYAGGITLLFTALRSVVRGYLDFDQAIVSATAKFTDINRATDEGRAKIEALKNAAREVGAQTEFSAGQAAQGLDFLAMAGFNANQAVALLPRTVDLATVANVDLARATDIASDAIGAFGLMTTDTAQLTENLARVNDVMAATITATNTDMEQLFETIKLAAPAFTTAGQSMETFNAIAGRMAANSIKASAAGTALRAGITRLAAPPAEAAAALNRLGISTKDSSGNMRNMIAILKDVGRATQNMGTANKAAALKAIFGQRAFSAYAAILNEGIENTERLAETLTNSGGAAERMAEVMRSSLLNQLKALGSSALELGFTFVSAFAEDGAGSIESLTEMLRDIKPIISAVAKTVSTVVSILVAGLPVIVPMLAAYFAYTKGLAAKTALLAWWTGVTAGANAIYAASTAAAASGTSVLSAAVTALGVAFSLNPIGLVIAAIAALIAIGVLLYKNWDTVKEKMVAVWGSIASAAEIAWANVKYGFLVAAKAIIDAVMMIYKPFVWVVDKIIGAFNRLTGKNIPALGSSMRNFTAGMDTSINNARGNISRLERDRAQSQAAATAADAARAASTENANARQNASDQNRTRSVRAGHAERTQSFKQMLEAIALSEQAQQGQQVAQAQAFFESRAEMEATDFASRIEFLESQHALIAEMDNLSAAQQVAVAKGITRAIEAEQRKRTIAYATYAKNQISTVSGMVSDLQTVFKNAGKESRALAITLKVLAMSEAAIASFLAFSRVLANPYLAAMYPANHIAAGITLAAGLAKQAAIASTPIPSGQTGLDYTVPDTPAMKHDGAAVRASAGEQVSITPRGEEAGGGDMMVNIDIGEDNLFRIIQRGITTGRIDISDRNIGRGVFAT